MGKMVTCPACFGYGHEVTSDAVKASWRDADGMDTVIYHDCSHCNGRGQVDSDNDTPMTDEIERLRAENTAMRSHIANLLEIADLALYYAPGEIGENPELANGMVTRARAFLAAHPAQESEA